jgi:hypothetical protein
MPHASLVGSGEKLGMDPWIGQLKCCALCREPFFSGAVGSVQIYRRLVKGCHVRGPPVGSIRGLAWEAYMSCWSGFPLQGVHRFKSP